MTMIALATYGDHAEFMTDSIAYTAEGSKLAKSTKFVLIPHMDAAVLAQGNSLFCDLAELGTLRSAGHVGSFDELVDVTPGALRYAWLDVNSEAHKQDHEPAPVTIFLVGYSERQSTFVAYSFASDQEDFEAIAIQAVFVLPSPFGVRPSQLETDRFCHDAKVGPEHSFISSWTSKPALVKPDSIDGWVALATDVREDRALFSVIPTFVAGDVFHTNLRRGESTTRRILRFNDEGDEFRQMVRGTRHPIGQLAECICDSDKAYLDCCLAPYIDAFCDCGSGQAFRDCCMVSREIVPSTPTARRT